MGNFPRVKEKILEKEKEMDLKQIKRIINLVESSKVTSLMIEQNGIKIEVKKESVSVNGTPMIQQVMSESPVKADPKAVKESETKDDNCVAIQSPMVGTFYTTPNPESDPFVRVGDKISKGQVVCIVEAMKLFNEIESEVSGTVEKILVDNTTPVEYGQDLFLIRVE